MLMKMKLVLCYERRHRIRELRLIVSASHPDALERCPV